jgi:hypothetical protein
VVDGLVVVDMLSLVVLLVLSCAEAESTPPQISIIKRIFFIVFIFVSIKFTNNMPKPASGIYINLKFVCLLFHPLLSNENQLVIRY